MLPWHLVKDLDGRVAQNRAWIAAVEQHATDPAVDDIREMAVKCTRICSGVSDEGGGPQVALAGSTDDFR